MTDSLGNDTVIYFQKVTFPNPNNPPTYNFYETQRIAYQGSQSSNNVLQTINTCYNGSASPCTATTITNTSAPLISRRTQLVAYPDNTANVSEHDQFFNVYGPSEQDDYDYATGAPASSPMRRVITPLSVFNVPLSITICNGSGTSAACSMSASGSSTGTVVAHTTFAYDETAVVAPTATTPPHVSLPNPHANP